MVNSSGASDSTSVMRAAISDSLSLKVAIAGLVLIALGVLIQDGAIPAFMVIWGTAFFVLGLLSYTVIWFNSS